MKLFLRYLGAAAVLVMGVFSIGYLQYRFDSSDLQHAVSAVRVARPLGAQDAPLEEKVASYFGVTPDRIFWQPEIESKWRGTVKVKAIPPQGGGNLIWRVDLVRLSVMPITPEAMEFSKPQP